eukprot:UN09462
MVYEVLSNGNMKTKKNITHHILCQNFLWRFNRSEVLIKCKLVIFRNIVLGT